MWILIAALLVALASACSPAGPDKIASPLNHISPAAQRSAPPGASALAADGGAAPATATRPIALGNPSALRHFFDALARLDDRSATDDVKIVQFGDSHTAADIGTGAMRKALQDRFGDGGRGFVAIGAPYKSYAQLGARGGMTRGFRSEHGPLSPSGPLPDGRYGLSGLAVVSRYAEDRAWADLSDRATSIEVAYLEQPGGGSFELSVDGRNATRIDTAKPGFGSGFRKVDVDGGPHHVEARSLGGGPVRLFGIAADRAEKGIVLDALGINGARFSTGLAWDETHMHEQLAHRAPDLVILAYGTNESADPNAPVHVARVLGQWIDRLEKILPGASCLVLGTPDRAGFIDHEWQTLPKIPEVVATEQRIAQERGCAFFDQLEAMGGPGSVAAWAAATPPRAHKDRVHLNKTGYTDLGRSVARAIVQAYEQTHAHSGMTPTDASPPPADHRPEQAHPDASTPTPDSQ